MRAPVFEFMELPVQRQILKILKAFLLGPVYLPLEYNLEYNQPGGTIMSPSPTSLKYVPKIPQADQVAVWAPALVAALANVQIFVPAKQLVLTTPLAGGLLTELATPECYATPLAAQILAQVVGGASYAPARYPNSPVVTPSMQWTFWPDGSRGISGDRIYQAFIQQGWTRVGGEFEGDDLTFMPPQGPVQVQSGGGTPGGHGPSTLGPFGVQPAPETK